MDEDLQDYYDVVVQGTGLVECLVAGAAARVGKSVLHLDNNSFYGGQWASFNLISVEEWATKQRDTSHSQPDAPSEEAPLPSNGDKLLPLVHPDILVYSNVVSSWHINEICAVTDDVAEQTELPLAASNSASSVLANDSITSNDATVEGVAAKEDASSPHQVPKPSLANTWDHLSLLDNSRKFNIDLAPNILYSRGDMVELLISSNVSRYVEFKCLSRILCWREGMAGSEGGLVSVPCSRAQVFNSKAVSLLEKRLLMKFLQFAAAYTEQPERWIDLRSAPLKELLTKERITEQLQDFVLRGMALSGCDVTVECGLRALRLFLTSLGRYGASPFLATLYGSGELPQAFCRLCAVFGGTYILQRGISALVSGGSPITPPTPTADDASKCVSTSPAAQDGKTEEKCLSKPSEKNGNVALSDQLEGTLIKQDRCQSAKESSTQGSVKAEELEDVKEAEEPRFVVSVVSGGRHIGCRHLVLEDAFASSVEGCTEEPCGGRTISRAILILSCDVLQDLTSTANCKSSTDEDEEERSGTAAKEGGVSLAQLSAADGRPVTAIQLASDTGTCASGTWLLHLTCDGSNAETDLRPSVEQLLQHHKRRPVHDLPNTEPSESPLLYSLYFNQRVRENVISPYPNLHFCGGPRNKLDYFDAIAQARDIFKCVCPGEEFMPRAPDPDEIIFDDPASELQKSPDGLSSEPSDEIVNQDLAKSSMEQKEADTISIDKPEEFSGSALES